MGVPFLIPFRLLDELKTNHKKQLEDIEVQHKLELRAVKERTSVEKRKWEDTQRQRMDRDMASKEKEIRGRLKEGRDKVRIQTCTLK